MFPYQTDAAATGPLCAERPIRFAALVLTATILAGIVAVSGSMEHGESGLAAQALLLDALSRTAGFLPAYQQRLAILANGRTAA